MKQIDRLAICTNCTQRKIDFEHGYVCRLTGSVADFQGECKHFEKDHTVVNTIKVRTEKRPFVPLFDRPSPPEPKTKKNIARKSGKAKPTANIRPPAKRRPVANSQPSARPKRQVSKSSKASKSKKIKGVALEKLRRYQSFVFAILGGLLFTLISATTWIVLTAKTGVQGVYIALGVALVVGLSVRFFGQGFRRIFGLVAALLTLLGSLIGYYLSQLDFLEEVMLSGITKVPDYFIPESMMGAIRASFVPLDLLFYGLAILLGYFLAIRRVNTRKLLLLEQDSYSGAPVLHRMRLPLILVGFLLPAFYGYTMVDKDQAALSAVYYDSGMKKSEGVMLNGLESGKWTYWYENGNIEHSGYFSNGIRDSLWQWYDESGNQTGVGSYAHGVENGTWINYYAGGAISDSGAFLGGLKEGLWRYNYETGHIKSTVNYKADILHGEKILYNASGKKVVVQNYEDGVLAE